MIVRTSFLSLRYLNVTWPVFGSAICSDPCPSSYLFALSREGLKMTSGCKHEDNRSDRHEIVRKRGKKKRKLRTIFRSIKRQLERKAFEKADYKIVLAFRALTAQVLVLHFLSIVMTTVSALWIKLLLLIVLRKFAHNDNIRDDPLLFAFSPFLSVWLNVFKVKTVGRATGWHDTSLLIE
ncbi:unnamed protein product [Protopolystoma xenopodis]|uniref:Uncharacterized protein n=1 Tax=Protopolystoma xenopodis TaxID=117903 RepID=A0A448WXD1_9PLAT|nr:unnamed protein product [Protopolystoma xenopodis]